MSGVVIGLGNRLRGDDAIGPIVIDRVAGKEWPDVRIVESEGEMSELISLMRGRRWCIIVDALSTSGVDGSDFGRLSPGTIVSRKISTNGQECIPRPYSSHAGGVFESVRITEALDEAPEQIYLVGIVGNSFGIGATVSQSVRAAVDEAEEMVSNLIGLLNSCSDILGKTEALCMRVES
jgi:hydrogenase maturation protease